MLNGTPDERKYLASKSFVLYFLYYFTESIKYPFADFHYEIFDKCERLLSQNEYKEYLLIAFRESAKSTIARAYVSWLVIFRKRKYILLGSYDLKNAESNLYSIINNLQNNKSIISDFGNICPDTTSKDKKGFNRIQKFLTTTGILLEAMSTQQSPRGKLHSTSDGGEVRPDFALLDDIENSKSVESDVITSKTKSFLKEIRTAIDSTDGRVWYLCNHISDIGVVQSLVDRAQDMLYTNAPLYDDEGNLLWDSKYTYDVESDSQVTVASIRKLAEDSITFEQEYLNSPMSEDRRVFKKSVFKYVDELPDVPLNCFVLIDPAITDKVSSDYTGVSIVWVDSAGLWYVKSYRVRKDAKAMIDYLFYLYQEHKPVMIGIEKFGYTDAIKPFLDEEMRRRKVHMPITLIDHQGTKKEVRIRGLLSYFEASTILFLRNECDELEEELLRFPRSKYDDVMDSLAYAPRIIYSAHESQSYSYNTEDEMMFPDIGL